MRVLVVVYAIEAGRGSEQGSGYNFCQQLASRPDISLTVVTRRNNAELLRRDPVFSEVSIIPFDPSPRLTFWKRGGRNIIAYYYLWQWTVARHLRRTLDERSVDVVHQYNFHTDWAPHFLHRLNVPVVWGPICHQPLLPREFFRRLSRVRLMQDRIRWLIKQMFWRLDLNLKTAAAKTDVILYANRDIAPPFSNLPHVRYQTFGGSPFNYEGRPRIARRRVRFLHVGRSVEIKGAHLALEAFSIYQAQGGRGTLTMVGDGPLRSVLGERASELGLTNLTFVEWISQDRLETIYAEADVFLYPSLGNQDTVVAEALSAGLPIIAFAGSGTEFMAGEAAITVTRLTKDIASRLSLVMRQLAEEFEKRPDEFAQRVDAAMRRSRTISWEKTAADIVGVYYELVP